MSESRQNITFGNEFERKIGFSRAVRVGNFIAVSGTAPIAQDGSVASPGDVHGQTKRCFEIIVAALAKAGASKHAVIRTRIMLTDIGRWEEAARAHAEFFADVRPACTFVEISKLINPQWIVEIEADAYAEG